MFGQSRLGIYIISIIVISVFFLMNGCRQSNACEETDLQYDLIAHESTSVFSDRVNFVIYDDVNFSIFKAKYKPYFDSIVVDFETEILIISSMGNRYCTYFDSQIISVKQNCERVAVSISESKTGGVCLDTTVSPYNVLTIAKNNMPVEFVYLNKVDEKE